MEMEETEQPEPWYKGPIKYIIMLFLLLIIVLWIFPAYSVKLNPEPKYIPSIKEVLPPNLILANKTTTIEKKEDFLALIKPDDPVIKQIANKIAAISCDGNKICQSKAIYYFVRDNFEYVSDPVKNEYIETPLESLFTGAMDCDGYAILLTTLQESIGINTQLVFIPSHVFVRINLPEASKRYKKGDWIYLDGTCKECDFGELPLQDVGKQETYLEVP